MLYLSGKVGTRQSPPLYEIDRDGRESSRTHDLQSKPHIHTANLNSKGQHAALLTTKDMVQLLVSTTGSRLPTDFMPTIHFKVFFTCEKAKNGISCVTIVGITLGAGESCIWEEACRAGHYPV